MAFRREAETVHSRTIWSNGQWGHQIDVVRRLLHHTRTLLHCANLTDGMDRVKSKTSLETPRRAHSISAQQLYGSGLKRYAYFVFVCAFPEMLRACALTIDIHQECGTRTRQA
jgi:hypothetical protein